jgi:cytoplasmic FMR1 interacting protein
MQITPFIYVEKTRNYDASKWSHSNATTECLQGKILEQIDRIRIEHTQYISELAKYSNDVAISTDTNRSDEESRNLYNLTLNGLKLLSKWTNTVLELVKLYNLDSSFNNILFVLFFFLKQKV